MTLWHEEQEYKRLDRVEIERQEQARYAPGAHYCHEPLIPVGSIIEYGGRTWKVDGFHCQPELGPFGHCYTLIHGSDEWPINADWVDYPLPDDESELWKVKEE